jgi:hypothetical protein
LIARDENQELVIYHLNANTVVKDNGKNITFDIIPLILHKENRIDMIYSTGTNQLISMSVSNEYDGTIEAIDYANQLLTIKNAQGEELTFPLNAQTVYEIQGNKQSAIQHFKLGDAVNVDLNSDQTAAGAVRMKLMKEYTVVSVNTSTGVVKVKNKDQREEELSVVSATVFRHSEKLAPTIADLQTGRTIFVSFVGKSVAQISIPSISFGKVTSVDAEAGTFTMTDYNHQNAAKTFKLNDKDIEVNDRVYVLVDVDRNQTLQELVSFDKTFWKMDDAIRTVYFLKRTLNDKNIFQLHERAVIRRNDALIPVSQLSNNTEVTGYLFNDTVIEISIR